MPALGADPASAGVRLRALLFVPGDRPERMDKALALGADTLILDLEDAVAPTAKTAARAAVADFLDRPRDHGVALIVRINPLDRAEAAEDLALVAARRPDAIMLPKAEGSRSIAELVRRLPDAPPILPIATETPAALFELGSYRDVADRLCGLTWGAEDLPAAIGAATSRDPSGALLPPYELARSLALFAAHAAGVPAIETVYPDFRDMAGLQAYAARAARDGFGGMMAIHPSQIAAIDAAFAPGEGEVARARAIVAAFDAQPGAGALQIDGRMVDTPHLKQARALIARSENRTV
jgi:citrate lyase subunit beta/citryl-CoA lyase